MRYVLILSLILLLSGCAGKEPPQVVAKPVIDVNSPEFKAMFTYILKVRTGERWGLNEYEADVEYYKGDK